MSSSLISNRAIAAVRLVFAAFAFSASASAAPYISFVAANGNDANPCTVVTAPCKTLQRAVNVTPASGTVSVLTPLQGHVTINKSITISGDGAPIVGTITINSASAIVTLRGLELNGVGIIANGINITSAAAVHIEDCTVERYTGDGITLVATTATQVFISDTVARENTGTGLWLNDANARSTVKDSRFENNGQAGLFLPAGAAYISDSVFTDNNMGISNGAAMLIMNCLIVNNVAAAIYNNGTLRTRQNNTVAGTLAGSNALIPYGAT